MSVESEIHGRATGHAGLNALISGRISEGRLAQNTTLPAIVYNRIGGAPVRAMGSDVLLTPVGMQMDVYAADAASLRLVHTQLLSAFQRWRNASGSPVIQASFVDNIFRNVYDPDVQNYRRTYDFTFWAEE